MKNILQAGTQFVDEEKEKHATYLINLTALIASSSSLTFCFLYYLMDWNRTLILNLVCVFFFVVVILLNQKGKLLVARSLLYWTPILQIGLTALFLGKDFGVHFILIPIAALGFITRPDRVKSNVLRSLMILLVFTFLQIAPTIPAIAEAESAAFAHYVYLVCVLLMAVIIIFVVFNFYQKTMEARQEVQQMHEEMQSIHETLVQAHKKLHKQNLSLNSSIRVAQRIQSATLPDAETITDKAVESFIFYQARDQVSGDFYWLHRDENRLLIAAADCTGHGVPGSLMAILGTSTLEQLVARRKATSPDVLLTEMDTYIRKSLTKSFARSQEDIEIGLVAVDLATKDLYFAGARNALFYIQSGESKLIKGNKWAIGSEPGEGENKKYDLHHLKIEQPTTFYLYSDGFQDQFGGAKNRKYLSKRFRSLLENLAKESHFSEHKEILRKELQNWKGNHEQTDDILVLGVKIAF